MRGAWAVWVLAVLWAGCVTAHPAASRRNGKAVETVWTESQALAVLRAGTRSSDSSTRAVAASAWIGSAHPSSSVLGGWVLADPSPHVQRVSARAASQVDVPLTIHPGTDTLAALWLGRSGSAVSDEHRALVLAIGGDEAALSQLLSDVSEGTISAESDVLELLIRSDLKGVGDALAQGSTLAEEPIRLPMALAAVAIGSEQGVQAVASLLKDTPGTELRIEAVEAMVRLGGLRAERWLERAAKGGSEAVAMHAKIGLVVFGHTSLDFVSGALDSPDRDTRAWAAQCLSLAAEERPLPRELIPRLQARARDEAPAVRWGAVEALLAGFGPGAVLLEPPNPGDEPDAVSMLIAAKWLEVWAERGIESSTGGGAE